MLANIVVNSTADNVFPPLTGLISLRNALQTANVASSPTTITFDPAVFNTPKTITLSGAALELANDYSNSLGVTTIIAGPTARLTIDGGGQSSGLNFVANQGGLTASVSNLTVTHCVGTAINSDAKVTLTNVAITDNNGGFSGGALEITNGTMTLVDATVANNTVTNNGGGIYNDATLVMRNVTLSGNKVTATSGANGRAGGGLFSTNRSSNTLTNVTVSGNTVPGGNGGGIDAYGATLSLHQVTIAGNSAGGSGGGLWGFGTISVGNSVIAGNTAVSEADVNAAVSSESSNLVGKKDGSSGFGSADFTGTVASPLDAKLGALADNGGPTLTRLPLAGSPLIDKGLNALIPGGTSTDQRGLARIANATVDIGAVEAQSVAAVKLALTGPSAQTATAGVAKSFALGSFTATNATAPFTVTIDWGDGTVKTIVTQAAVGTIASQSHAYATSGAKTISVSVADAKTNKSNTATSAVAVAAAPAAVVTVTAPAAQVATAGVAKSFALGSFTATNATAPFAVTVDWGDGTAKTIFTQATAGTITAQSHAYATSGAKTISVFVADAKANKSNTATSGVTVAAAPATVLTVTAAAAQAATAGIAKSFALGSFITTNATAPYTVTVDWGDGTAKTTFTQAAAGTITAQSHVYAGAGAKTIGVFVTDAKLVKSNTATSAVTAAAAATASIAGTVFKDADGDGLLDAGELGLASVVLYLDANNNGAKDATEVTATSDANGLFKFGTLVAGTYVVRQVAPTGYAQTAPAANAAIAVALAAGQAVTGKLFGDKPLNTASISGTVFNDVDADGVFDAAELGLGLYQVYLDANKNGKLDAGETVVTTDADGNWAFTGLAAATYTVRVVQRAKTAATTSAGVLTITLANGQGATGKLFGEKRVA